VEFFSWICGQAVYPVAEANLAAIPLFFALAIYHGIASVLENVHCHVFKLSNEAGNSKAKRGWSGV